MANSFVSGVRPIAVGVDEFNITGLQLPFTPSSVIVSVRQPVESAALITAYVVGEPSVDGFKVVLNAPAAVEGYLLDFTAFSNGSITPVDGDTNAVCYDDLVGAVAIFLGYNKANLTDAQKAEVDSYIQSGLRNYYYPPKSIEGVDENFEWSFIRQSGSVTTASGTDRYLLPDGMGRIAGEITVQGDNGFSLPLIPYGDIAKMRGRPEVGRPRFASIVYGQVFGGRGQRKLLHLYPIPDAEYLLDFVCDADTGKIDSEERPFPLGGAMFSELLIESCLAIAEQRANDEEGLHTKKFTELLVSSIARDRKSSAQVFGDIGDPEARGGAGWRPLRTRGFLY